MKQTHTRILKEKEHSFPANEVRKSELSLMTKNKVASSIKNKKVSGDFYLFFFIIFRRCRADQACQ